MAQLVTLTVGIPCSGKSTWVRKKLEEEKDLINDVMISRVAVSRDEVRGDIFGKTYKQHSDGEKLVTKIFNDRLKDALDKGHGVYIDNTHCKESYLNEQIITIKSQYPDVIFRIVFFNVSLYKAYFRNIIRRIRTGKWIPPKVIKAMKKNFDKIDQHSYTRKGIVFFL